MFKEIDSRAQAAGAVIAVIIVILLLAYVFNVSKDCERHGGVIGKDVYGGYVCYKQGSEIR